VGQQLIEDNILAVSRQMIDKEATMPKKTDSGAPPPSSRLTSVDEMEVEE